MSRDPYATLNVSPTASQAEIRQSYQRLARALHPDKNPGPAAADVFGEVESAWRMIGDEEERRVFDELGHDGVRTMALIKSEAPSTSGSLLLDRVRRKLERAAHAQDVKRFNVRGNIRADARLEELVRTGAFAFIAVQQSVDFVISNKDRITVSATAGSRRGEQVLGVLSLAHHHLGKHGALEWAASAGSTDEPAALGLKLHRPVGVHTAAEVELQTKADGTAGLGFALYKRLGTGLDASLSLGAGLLDGVRLGLQRHQHGLALEGSVGLSRKQAGIECSAALSDGPVRRKVALRLLASGAEAELELLGRLGALSGGALGLVWSQQHGLFLKLRASRGGVRIDVPLLLSPEPTWGLAGGVALLPALAELALRHALPLWRARADAAAKAELRRARDVAKQQRLLMLRSRAGDNLITEARFGRRLHLEQGWDDNLDEPDNIDVAAQLDFFARDGGLVLAPPLAGLLGFYDPCALRDEPSRLFVRYKADGRLFEAFFDADEAVVLPSVRAVEVGRLQT